MKNITFVLLLILALGACRTAKKSETQVTLDKSDKKGIEVLYFHGKQRCLTCNAIETLTKEVIEQEFAQEYEKGIIMFKSIDISTEEGKTLADKYQIAWSSLLVNKHQEQQELVNNMTNFGFAYAKSAPNKFKEGIKKKLNELLIQ